MDPSGTAPSDCSQNSVDSYGFSRSRREHYPALTSSSGVMRRSLHRFLLSGADNLLKDRNFWKFEFFAHSPANYPLISRDSDSLLDLPGENPANRRGSGEEDGSKEESREAFSNSDYHWDRRRSLSSRITEVDSAPLRGRSEVPFKFMIRYVRFQLRMLINCCTYPLRLVYYSFMLLLFPLQTVDKVRECLVGLLSALGKVTVLGITNLISDFLTERKRNLITALRFFWAFCFSISVFFVLFVMLISGFMTGGFIMKHLVEEPVQIKETLNLDYTEPSPVASVPLVPSLVSKGSYEPKLHLHVSLSLPESEYNRNVGVFQVRVEFISAKGEVVGRSSSYPTMLHFNSAPIRLMETLLKSAPLIMGFRSESQVLDIRMRESIMGAEAITSLKGIIEPRANNNLQGNGVPAIYSASLEVESDLPFRKKIIWKWRKAIFVWGSMLCFLTELVFVLVFCLWL